MCGVEILGELLTQYEPLIEVLPADNMKGGVLPDGIALPALVLKSVSLTDRQPLKWGPLVRSTERVAVAVRAASYEQQKALIRLIRSCCSGRTGNIGGGLNVSIRPAGTGPDMNGPANSFEQTQDFRVSYDAPA